MATASVNQIQQNPTIHYKLVLLGDASVGKSCLVVRYGPKISPFLTPNQIRARRLLRVPRAYYWRCLHDTDDKLEGCER